MKWNCLPENCTLIKYSERSQNDAVLVGPAFGVISATKVGQKRVRHIKHGRKLVKIGNTENNFAFLHSWVSFPPERLSPGSCYINKGSFGFEHVPVQHGLKDNSGVSVSEELSVYSWHSHANGDSYSFQAALDKHRP